MAEPRTLRAEAVVLRHSEMGEADRLLVLFTREQGKIRAIAKGVRKIRSRKAGHLQPFSRTRLMLARGKSLWIITQAELIDSYLPLRDDLERTAYAAYVIELMDRFTFDDGPNPPVYRLLVNTLSRIAESQNPEVAVRYYDLRLLDLMGFRPEIFQCVHCGEAIQAEDQYFSAFHGGAVCPNCRHSVEAAVPVSLNALRYLRHFQRSSYEEALRAEYHAEVFKEMERLLQYYYLYILERKLNTTGFIQRIRDE
ncbi:MAG: DNA repair protein RecO [Anaerolineaceae bacterium]|nr:DNA repair protein RecO [Anaerolineaceae bacterium]